jgi:hypothetical protein
MDQLEQRFETLRSRIQTAYEGLGQSSGRPYLYFVYPPEDEQRVSRLIDEQFVGMPSIHCIRLDLLMLTIDSLRGEEQIRQELLDDPDTAKSGVAPLDIAGLWQYEIRDYIERALRETPPGTRPLVLLEGLAALYPLTNPTAIMEKFAEQSFDNPVTRRPVPVVLFVPGYLLPHTSRTYYYLTQTSQPLLLYRGEDL